MTQSALSILTRPGLRQTRPGCLLVAMLCGCGSTSTDLRQTVYPVSGKLLSGNQPAVGAIVALHPLDKQDSVRQKAERSLGTVGDSGEFVITTYETGDGAPAGDYAMTIDWPGPREPGSPPDEPGPDRLQGRYLDPARPLRKVTVKPDENRWEPIHLDHS